jgi:hypothetical protein
MLTRSRAKAQKQVYYVDYYYITPDNQYIRRLNKIADTQPPSIKYQNRMFKLNHHIMPAPYPNQQYLELGNNTYKPIDFSNNYVLIKKPKIKEDKQKLKFLNITYRGKRVQRRNYNCSEPLDSSTVSEFATAFSKMLRKKISGKLWLVCNFNIGYRSSKTYDIGEDIAAYDPNDFDIYNDVNNEVKFDQKISDFYIIFVQDNKSKSGGNTVNKYNDCLFNALELCGVPLPKEINTQPKLKKFLGLDRASKVDYRRINDIAPLYKNISISVIGDYQLTPVQKHLNITLKLKDGHYTLGNNEARKHILGVKYKPTKEDQIWSYYEHEKSKYTVYNGCITRKLDLLDFKKMKLNNNLLFIKSSNEDFKDNYFNFLYKCETMLDASNGLIDLTKYPSQSLAALDVWRRLSKPYNYSDELKLVESNIINNAFKGGLMFCEKGYTGYGIAYDVNSAYPATMINNYFQLPLEQGEPRRINQDEFRQLKYFSYGIYRAKILLNKSNNNYKLFKINKTNYYTHYDLTLAKELGFDIELIYDNEFNFYYYSKEKLIKGKLLFGQFVSKLYELKSNKIDGAKDVMNALWGSFSQRNKYNKIVNDDIELQIPDEGEILGFSCTRAGDLKIKYNSNKNKLFKRDEGRWSCFFTSFTRMQIARELIPYVDNIVRIQTDGFILNKNIDVNLDFGTNIGQWKKEYEGEIQIIAVNDIIKF